MPSRIDEFAELVLHGQHQLLSYIFAFVRNQHDAEDLYQQTLFILWNKFDAFDRSDPASDFGVWARKVARFEIANFLKTKRRSHVYFSDALIAEIDDTISKQETTLPDGSLATLRLCMDKLSKVDRVLVQDFYGGMPAKNIAQQSDRSVEGVYNSLCRVRRSLLECIRRTEEGERK